MNKKKLFWWCATLGIMVGIFIFSSQPSVKSSSLSGEIVDMIVKPILQLMRANYHEIYHTLVRKIAHFSIYGLLGISSFNLLRTYQTKRPFIFSLLICFLYACSDEFHQTYITGRTGEFRDVCIDLTGSFFAIVIMLIVNKQLLSYRQGEKSKN